MLELHCDLCNQKISDNFGAAFEIAVTEQRNIGDGQFIITQFCKPAFSKILCKNCGTRLIGILDEKIENKSMNDFN